MYPYDDESVLSGLYTESGDSSVAHNTVDPEDDDDEMFRRAVQAEQGRVMREFGVLPPPIYTVRSDETSVEEETCSDNSSELRDKTTSTPETYDDEAYGVEDEESDGNDDASTFHQNKLFPSSSHAADTKQPAPSPILTPRRLKIIMVVLCVIFVASIAVAMGSFLAQKEGESPARAQADADIDTDNETDVQEQDPDPDQPSVTIPVDSSTASPTASFHWKEGECVDHPSHKFIINEQYGEQDCSFLRTNLGQRARLCLLGKDGYRWCPVTCGVCLKDIAPSISPTPARLNTPSSFPESSPSPSVEIESSTATPTTLSPTANPTFVVATEAPTPESTPDPTAAPTAADTMLPTLGATTIATAAPTIEATSSYFCRTCPFKICEILPCD